MDPIHRTVVREAFPVTYFAGKHATQFYERMRDEKTIIGNKCPQCDNVYVPPIDFCRKCFCETGENWVDCGTQGILYNYSILHVQFPGYVLKPPFIYAYIKLDGSDDWFIHIMRETHLDKVKRNIRVEAVWDEEAGLKQSNIGHIFQPIKYFRPVDPEFRADA